VHPVWRVCFCFFSLLLLSSDRHEMLNDIRVLLFTFFLSFFPFCSLLPTRFTTRIKNNSKQVHKACDETVQYIAEISRTLSCGDFVMSLGGFLNGHQRFRFAENLSIYRSIASHTRCHTSSSAVAKRPRGASCL